MDKASDFESEECAFESRRGRYFYDFHYGNAFSDQDCNVPFLNFADLNY